MKTLLIAFAFLACTSAHADEASKRAKIGKLVVAQGLEQMMQQQLDQASADVSSLGDKVFTSMVGNADAFADPSVMKRLRAVHTKFLADVSNVFSARELVDGWSASYGKDLTESDIDKILAYYLSPTGQKDVAASKAAMAMYSKTMAEQSEQRVFKLIDQFKKEMDAALKQ